MTVPALVGMGHTEASAAAVLRKAVSLASSCTGSTSSPTTPTASSTTPTSSSFSNPLTRLLNSSSSSRTPSSSPSRKGAAPSKPRSPAKVVLALGPYGSTLSPGQEYSGLYPPPYGPAGFDPSNSNVSNYASESDERNYEAALTEFHLSRLRVYAEDPETWDAVAWVAFETVPVLREIRAIRRAMGILRAELRAQGRDKAAEKPFWIASAYPGGKIGQKDAKGNPVAIGEVVAALVGKLSPLPSSASAGADGQEDGNASGAAKAQSEGQGQDQGQSQSTAPTPDGIGINCTHLKTLPVLIGALSGSLIGHHLRSRPWLMLYPDGGAVYDVVTKTWTGHTIAPQEWAERLVALSHEAEGTGVWRGVVLGGCCKSSFDEIAALRKLVDRPMEREWEKSADAAAAGPKDAKKP